MAKYSVGIETKSKILDAARILFYDLGYHNTTFQKICEVTHENPGTVIYHFKSKWNLANLIRRGLGEATHEAVEQFFPAISPIEKNMLAFAIIQNIYYLDVNIRRFAVEFENSCDANEKAMKVDPKYVEIVAQYIPEEEAEVFVNACSYASGALTSYIDQKCDICPFERMIRYIEKFNYSFLPDQVFDTLFQNIMRFMSQLDIQNENFSVAVSWKQDTSSV